MARNNATQKLADKDLAELVELFVLELPDRVAALVTPDRGLARRVAGALRLFQDGSGIRDDLVADRAALRELLRPLLTPRLDRCGVAGVTRDRILDAAARDGLSCRIESFTWDAVLRADETFLVNSLAGVWPVRALDDHARVPGPVTRRLQRALQHNDDAQTH